MEEFKDCLIPNKYWEALLSIDDEDFNLAIILLLDEEKYPPEFIVEEILTLYKIKELGSKYGIIYGSDGTIIRNHNIGLWAQLDNSYKHTYCIRTFNLDMFEEALKNYQNNLVVSNI